MMLLDRDRTTEACGGPEADVGSAAAIPRAVASRMACPDCKGPLAVPGAERLECVACGAGFRAAAGGRLPILLPSDSPLLEKALEAADALAEKTPTRRISKPYRQARRLPRTNVTQLSKPYKDRFFASVGKGTILNVGSGRRELDLGAALVRLDIQPHPNCDVVGDAHHLPFLDGSFDAVMSDSVFEHLANPFQAAREVARVLRPGGTMWCSVPLAYPIHGSPNDYFRFTVDGLRSVFRDLRPVEIGPALGPITTIALFAERVADALLPGKLGFAARWCTAWLLQPWKYLDPWVVRRNPRSASAVFILAEKPQYDNHDDHAPGANR